jgi:hypothetical protein
MRTWPIFFFLTAACTFAQNTVAVFVNTNQVWSYARASDGTLSYAGTFDMEGQGARPANSDRRTPLRSQLRQPRGDQTPSPSDPAAL